MEKIKCPKCGKMNTVNREYCWLCAYKLQNINHNLEYLYKGTTTDRPEKANYSNKIVIMFFILGTFFF